MRILPAPTCRTFRTTFMESLERLAFPGIQKFAADRVTARIRIQLNVTHWSIENGNTFSV
jgi:hypothetical protein